MQRHTSRRQFLAAASVASVASVAALGTTTAACSAGGSTSPSSGSGGKAEGALTLWVGSWWTDQVPTIESALGKDHPELQLKIEPLPINGYPDKFTAAALSGAPPDIIDLDATMVSTIAAKNLLTAVDDVAATLEVKDYAQGIWQASRFHDTQYAIPDRASSSVYFYNKTCFDKAGVKYPTDDWTYDQFLDTVKKLTIDEQYGVGLAADLSDPANAMDFLSASIWAHGGDFVTSDGTASAINTAKAVAGITFWTELYTTHKVCPPGTPNFTTSRDLLPLFEANKVALVNSGSNALEEFAKHPDLKFGLVMLPDKINRGGGWTMGIPNGAKNPAAAKAFIEWFAQPKIMAAMMNRTPARVSANKLPPWNDKKYDVFTAALEFSRALPSVANWTQMQTAIITEVQKVLVGKSTPQQAADAAAQQMNSLLSAKQ